MTREEIIARLTDLLGEEQAAATADALIGAEETAQTPESESESTEMAEPTAPEPGTSEAEPKPEATEPEVPDAEPESIAPEPDPSEELRTENDRLRDQLKGMMVRLAAMSLGVAPERVDAVRRLAEFGDGELTEETALAAVRRVLEEVPELAGRAAMPVTGSIGTHPRESARPMDPFEKGFFR